MGHLKQIEKNTKKTTLLTTFYQPYMSSIALPSSFILIPVPSISCNEGCWWSSSWSFSMAGFPQYQLLCYFLLTSPVVTTKPHSPFTHCVRDCLARFHVDLYLSYVVSCWHWELPLTLIFLNPTMVGWPNRPATQVVFWLW